MKGISQLLGIGLLVIILLLFAGMLPGQLMPGDTVQVQKIPVGVCFTKANMPAYGIWKVVRVNSEAQSITAVRAGSTEIKDFGSGNVVDIVSCPSVKTEIITPAPTPEVQIFAPPASFLDSLLQAVRDIVLSLGSIFS